MAKAKTRPDHPPVTEANVMPRYPVYVPSKGRHQFDRAFTARILAEDGVPFILAVESTEVEQYRALCRQINVPEDYVHDIGFHDLGQGAVPVRNWISDHARESGVARQWQLDDNDWGFYRVYKGKRMNCRAGLALRVCEDLTDRYENVGLSGLNYDMFGIHNKKPFNVNCHVYSCTLVNCALPYRWRGPYNDDTDLCLQVLSGGWCTILLNAFLVKKKAAFSSPGVRTVEGGMSSAYTGDGRLKMARSLERRWPYVVTTGRRFQRPQHIVRDGWKRFDTPLRLRADVDLSAMPKVDEYGMSMTQMNELKSKKLQGMVAEYGKE